MSRQVVTTHSFLSLLLLAVTAAAPGCAGTPVSNNTGASSSSTGSTGSTGVSSSSTGDGASSSSSGAGGSSSSSGDTGGSASSGGAGGASSSSSSSSSTTTTSSGSVTPQVRMVAYLPNYTNSSYAQWATMIDFSKMTHLNLAFATADSGNGWDMGASDSDVATLVTAAHAAGVKVLASLGGGGGDQTVIAQYKNGSNVAPLVANLDTFVSSHHFDGVDVDIEDPNNLGSGYSAFVSAVVGKLRPEGKLITAAVAQYLQDSMEDSTLHTFDFLNVMIYSNYGDSVSGMTYYAQTKSVPSNLLNLGAGFFGTDSNGNEYAYSDIIAADPNAWSYDQTQVQGTTVNYTGVASMQKLTTYSEGYGGIMFWDLSQDVTGAHSLYKAIQGAL